MAYNRYDCEQMIDLLAIKYPACFFKIPQQRQPLKNDILDDLARDKTLKDPGLIEATIGYYKNHLAYRHQVAQRNPRINLDGKVVAQVTDTESDAEFIEIQRIQRHRKIAHDFSREVVVERVERKAPIVISAPPKIVEQPEEEPEDMPTAKSSLPKELVPLFELIDKRLAKAKTVAADMADDPELGAQMLVTVLRGLAESVNGAIESLNPTEAPVHLVASRASS